MDLPKHYKLHSESDSHFVIHDERDGKQFKVAKKQLHPASQIKVMKMQKFDDGGKVKLLTGGDGPEKGVVPQSIAAPSPEEGVVPQSIAAPSPEDSSKGIEPVNMSVPTSITNQDDAANANPNTMTAQDTSGTMGSFPTSQELKSAIGSQASGVEKEASATEKQNQALAAQYQKNIDQEQKLMESYNQKVQEKENQYNDLFSQVSQGKIDPKAYWKDHSKLGAAIGIMLGGIGAGLTRGPNLGLQVIQKNIENEIEAQKENLGNKRSLLSENLRSQGNMTGAMNATRLQMMAMAQGRIAQVAAQTGNPIIQAQAQQKIALMHQSTIPLRSQLAGNEIQMAIRKDVINRLKSPRSGGEPDVDMQDLARAGLVDKATAEKEQAAITKRQQAEAFLTDQVKKLDEEQSVFGGNFPYINPLNPESYKRRDQFIAGVIQTIQSASASKRLNPEMLATEAEPFLTKTMDSEKTREEGLTGLINLIRSHADATPQASHYNVPGALRKNTMTRKSYELGPVK